MKLKPPAEMSHARRIGVLLICTMALLISGLDITAVNVALPSIGRELHATVPDLQWTIDAYTVVLASLLMLAGSTADRLGRKETFIVGLSVFCLGSFLCSRASSVDALVAFRVLQAIGGSMLNPVAMSIITNTFTDPRERAMAVGVWATTFGLSVALGPVVGGVIVSLFSWRVIFLINVPVCLAAIALTVRFVPTSKSLTPRRFDPLGQIFVMVLLASLTYGIIEAPGHGWTSARIVIAFLLAVLALGGLVFHEPRRDQPLIDLRFFRSVPFSASVLAAIVGAGAFGGYLFLNTLYLQDARGFSALRAGLYTLPMALMMMVVSPISARIVGSRGPRIPMMLSGVAYVIGCVLLTGLSDSTSIVLLLCSYVLFGFGFGMLNPPITNGAVSGMPRAQAGVAAAIATTSRQFGQTLGVAIVGAIVSSSVGGPTRSSLPQASHPAWWMLAGAGVILLLVGYLSTTAGAMRTARTTATALNPEALAQ